MPLTRRSYGAGGSGKGRSMAEAARDSDKIMKCTAFLERHQISAVLEACIGAVLSSDSGDLVAALADEVRLSSRGAKMRAAAPLAVHVSAGGQGGGGAQRVPRGGRCDIR